MKKMELEKVDEKVEEPTTVSDKEKDLDTD